MASRDTHVLFYQRRLSRVEGRTLRRGVAVAAVFFLFAVAISLRFFRLASVPPPLADEVLGAVDLRSALKVGHHFTGDRLGLVGYLTPSLDGRYAVAAIFGESVPDLRLASAAFGTITIGAVALLAREISARTSFAVIAASALAVMPWHVFDSRIFLPQAESVLTGLLAVLLVLDALRKRSLVLATAAALIAVVSIYLYPVAIVTTPLFLATAVVFRRKELSRFGLARGISVGVVGIGLIIPYVIGRLSHDRLTEQINEVIGQKMIWNHGLGWERVAQLIGEHWLSYLTPGFLFFHGDPNVRLSIQSMGQVGWALGALGVGGVVLSVIRRRPADLFLLSWLVIYPLGDALTYYDATANSLRAAMGSVVWALFAASGLDFALQRTRHWRRVILLAGVGVVVAIQVVLFATAYFGSYPRKYGYAFETGYSRVYGILKRRGVEDVPVTVHAGYERDQIFRYFSDYKLRIVEQHAACYKLPYDVVHYTVLPRVFIIREDRDYAAVSGCIVHGLLARDLKDLRRKGVVVEVLARFRNAPTSELETGILFVQKRPATWSRVQRKIQRTSGGAMRQDGLRLQRPRSTDD
jgi:Dolichyl-phosphate-mannose-protein mannosyltransferase